MQISQTLYRSYIENVSLFKGCSSDFIFQIVSLLLIATYLSSSKEVYVNWLHSPYISEVHKLLYPSILEIRHKAFRLADGWMLHTSSFPLKLSHSSTRYLKYGTTWWCDSSWYTLVLFEWINIHMNILTIMFWFEMKPKSSLCMKLKCGLFSTLLIRSVLVLEVLIIHWFINISHESMFLYGLMSSSLTYNLDFVIFSSCSLNKTW